MIMQEAATQREALKLPHMSILSLYPRWSRANKAGCHLSFVILTNEHTKMFYLRRESIPNYLRANL